MQAQPKMSTDYSGLKRFEGSLAARV